MSLADGAAYEKEFGLPEVCKHLVEKSNCISCSRAISRVHDEVTLHVGASAHAEYIFWSPAFGANPFYEYDPADDGPEVAVIKAIRAKHYVLDLTAERLRLL